MGLWIQSAIHRLEIGAGRRYLRFVLLGLAILALAFLYDFRGYKNFSTPGAMDSAQLARNIADGKGYTTLFIRPLSLYLVQKHNETKTISAPTNTIPDFARIQTAHPDLANPPVYPFVLAGLMKILPFHFNVELKRPFWSDNEKFARYQPDFLIALFNEILLLAAIALTFCLARKLFDANVAWLAAVLMLGCELLWRFSASGLSTMLLLLIFLGLAWCILKIEELAREPQPNANQILRWSLATGGLIGIGALTRYAFGWTIIPVALFLLFFSGQKRFPNALAAFVAFVILLTPWIVRNFLVSGTPFGTAGFSIVEGTFLFPQFQLERSLHPDFSNALWPTLYFHKLFENLRPIFQNDLPKLGGSWASILFLAGLLLNFRSPAIRRMRYFLLLCLGTFIVVQALGRTQLSEESPEVNSENMLILLAPLVFIFGAAFFFSLLDQMILPAQELRYAVISIFVLLCCLPLIFALRFKTSPVSYPPYYPPDIQKTAGWMKPDELMMSDVPWAVAWYGNRQCAWLTRNAQNDFFAINDYLKPVSGLYLTMQTMDGRLVSDCLRSGENGWGNFVLQALTQNKIPKGFPLRHSPSGSAAISSGLFLTDLERWKFGKNSGE